MASQTPDDGIEWAFGLFMPSAVAIALIYVIEGVYGSIWAGFASLILTVIVFGGVLMSLKYWHIPSTVGFLIAGFFLWNIVPDATAEIIPWPFQILQTIVIAVFFAIGIVFLLNKFGVEAPRFD